MRIVIGGVALTALMALTACEVPIPDSAAGVDFTPRISDEPLNATSQTQATTEVATGTATEQTETSIGADALAALGQTTGDAPLEASPSNPAPQIVNAAGISQENDFAAVDAQRSIEDDAARRAQIAAQYQQIQATDLPTAGEGTGPNIVEYAVLSSNPLGNKLYNRLGFNAANRFARNCRDYPSSDQAQIDFLSRGGPERDPRGLDPDGDGYACDWDPTPFQRLRN